MILPFALPKLPALARYVGLGALALFLILGSAFLLVSQVRKVNQDGVEAGKIQAQAESSAVILKSVENAHEATRQIDLEAARGSGDLMFAQCVRSARNPENCQRFLPGGSADISGRRSNSGQ